MWPAKYHFFIYRVKQGEALDQRCPCGGIVIDAWSEGAMVAKAFGESIRRFPCKPWEFLVVMRVKDKVRCRQAMLMDRDWEQEYYKFERLMTVS
jgi:hypothetical protein